MPKHREPMWEDILPFLVAAPPNTTVSVKNHTFGSHLLDKVELRKSFDLPLEATLSRSVADALLLPNLSAGDTAFFVGEIPLYIVNADENDVTYRFNLEGSTLFEIPRSIGLAIRADPRPELGIMRFSLDVPEGVFTAHNNCQLVEKLIAPGHYVLRGESRGALLLDRYNSATEEAMEHTTGTIEVTFLDGFVHETPRVANDQPDIHQDKH